MILRELEAERAPERIGIVALDDIEAPGVGARNEAALLEDEIEELVELALGRNGFGDLDELAELVAISIEPFSAALGARFGLEQLEGVVNGDEELVGARIGGDEGAETAIQRLGEIRLGRAAEQDQERLAVGEPRGERAQ